MPKFMGDPATKGADVEMAYVQVAAVAEQLQTLLTLAYSLGSAPLDAEGDPMGEVGMAMFQLMKGGAELDVERAMRQVRGNRSLEGPLYRGDLRLIFAACLRRALTVVEGE